MGSLVVALACAGRGTDDGPGETRPSGDRRLFVPDDLPNIEIGGEGGLTLVAFTLVDGTDGPELFTAVRNEGDVPACEAGITIDFFDENATLVTSSSGVLESGTRYDLNDGSGATIRCVSPGRTAMAASTDLPTSLVIDELGALEHRFPAFVVPGVTPADAFFVSEVRSVARGGGTAYRGTFENALDVTVTDPKVTIFPLNRVGRPLGAATSRPATSVSPGGSVGFETDTVGDSGADFVAFADATIP
jgi:hypothetical protein